MRRSRPLVLVTAGLFLPWALAAASALSPPSPVSSPASELPRQSSDEQRLHEQAVMSSKFCSECHPAIYAEHERSTHGRAFTDEEVRLATGRFAHGDCIICHTPRPIFETGIGMNPMRRHYNLQEGNTCMTCHWKEGYDYGSFHGGVECSSAFDERVGEVEACASCHRNHGTPYQWATSPLGAGLERTCVDCHMRGVTRPVAVGEEPRRVSSHTFPGSRDEEHLRRAYTYDARIEGNEVVITIENSGAGHNFPTELKQRSLESLVLVKDVDGNEVSRSRQVHRDPYKRPYGLHLPVNTQIPSGQSVEHRVPIRIASGTVECELHFKLYFPIEDDHPDLARRLEVRRLLFTDITPSDKPVISAPSVRVVTPEAIAADAASPANLVDFARPAIDTVEVDIPQGTSEDDLRGLVELFQFPVPAANRAAQERLAEIGAPAFPVLLEALGSWDNKTYNQAMHVLAEIGAPAIEPLIDALASEELYVRVHARNLLVRMDARGLPELEQALLSDLTASNALDRRSAAEALGELGVARAVPSLSALLEDRDPDVVRAAARSLSRLEATHTLPLLRAAYGRFLYPETRRDLALAMAQLGSHEAVPLLMDGLDLEDDLIRESHFEALFAVTGLHLGYDPLAPRPERLDAISRLRAHWAVSGEDVRLRPWRTLDHGLQADCWGAIKKLGDTDEQGKPKDEAARAVLEAAGQEAVPALVKALKYPAGFDRKRMLVCQYLGRTGSLEAVPALIGALRDPVITVASWACWALEAIGDPQALRSVQRYERRLHTLAAQGRIPVQAGSGDALLAQSARTRFSLGEEAARHDLVKHLLSTEESARRTAIDALREIFGFDLGFVADAPIEDRRRAAAEWAAALQ